MAIIRKAPNGELVSFPDGTTEAQIQETFNSEQYQSAKVIDKPTEGGVLSDLPPALKNNWAFDTFAVAPYEASRKAINSAVGLVEDLGDTLGDKTTLGGFRYGKDANNGLIEYIPYKQAVQEADKVATYGILAPITGAIGVNDAFNIKGFFYDPTNPDNDDHTTSMSGNFVEGIGQFVIGFKGADKLFKLRNVPKAKSTLGAFGQASAKGALADFTVFDENSGRMTDLLAEYAPETVDSYFGYLKSDVNDEWWEARFKNTIEGLGLGSIAEALFRGVRFGKAIRDRKIDTKTAKEDQAYLEKTNNVFDEVGERLNEAQTISQKMDILNTALDEAFPKKFKTKQLNQSQRIKIINDTVKSGLKNNFERWNKGELTSEEAFNIPEGFINLDTFKLKNPKTGKNEGLTIEGVRTFKSFYDAITATNTKLTKRMTDEAVKRKAINDYGGDVNQVFQDFAKFADNVDNTNSLIFAHEVAYTSLLNAFPKFIRQYKKGNRTKGDMELMMFMIENMTINAKRVRTATGRNLRIFNLTKEEFLQAKYVEEEFINARNAYKNFGGGQKGFDMFLERLGRADNPTVGRQVLNFAFKNRMWNVANEIWINALLSSPKTQLVNAVSNGVIGMMRPMEEAIGSKISELISFNDLDKAKAFKLNTEEAIARYAGMTESLSASLKYAGVAFRNGELVLQSKDAGASKFDTSVTKEVPDYLGGAIVRTPSRFLNATDEFFKQINYRGKLKAQAVREAKRLGLTKKTDIKKYVDEYIKQGYDETGLRGVNEEALRYAEENTFTNELVGFTDKFADLVNSQPYLKQFFPFVKTPTNIAKAIADRSPLALAYRMGDILGRSGDPVAIAKARGQLAVGSIILSVAYILAQQGKLQGRTGKVGEKNLDIYKDAEIIRMKKSDLGFKPYSYVFDDGRQLPFGQLDPYGALLGIMVDFVSVYDQMTEEEIERFGADMQLLMLQNGGKNPLDFGQKAQIFAGSGYEAVKRNIFSKTYLRGLADLVEAFNTEDERAMQRYLSQKIGSYVPNIVYKFVNDPYYRDATTILEQVKNRTGMGTPSSPRYNALGEAHKDKDSGIKRFIKNAINPLATTQKRSDIIAEEIVRLGKGLPVLPKFMDLVEYAKYKKGKVSAYDRMNQLVSTITINGKTLRQALEAEIQLDSYKNKSDPITIGKGITDNGSKYERLRFIQNQYIQKAKGKFELEKKDYLFVDNEKLTLKKAIANNKANSETISRNRGNNQNIKLKPIITFGQNQ